MGIRPKCTYIDRGGCTLTNLRTTPASGFPERPGRFRASRSVGAERVMEVGCFLFRAPPPVHAREWPWTSPRGGDWMHDSHAHAW